MLHLLLLAVTPAADVSCSAAVSTQAIVACFSEKTKAADTRLNAAYRRALVRVPARQARSLRTAQRAWIGFRDADCRAVADGEGTVARIEAAQCLADLTSQRARALERFGRRN